MTKFSISCNGCKVLRKACGENCTIRPCLLWIEDPDSQANATVFLTKFYGRTGLVNLINSGPDHLRPALFRSLLYEACGRIVNPVFGSVGLLWSGKWQLCQAAVDAVLRGEHTAYIGPVSKESRPLVSAKLHGINKATSTRFKPSLASIRFFQKNSSTLMESLLGALAENSNTVSQTDQSNWIDQMAEEKKSSENIDLSLGLAPPTIC